eukprot:CAMPEP_0177685166 /NCGR_PEP_ID=MMETSP0447-20121125/32866_1 /TAXON_ID=0 /ORGANISM="Stygamoeba regulata, Strain BSH-02190019" /LENGTH=61 /DNA_ID=CAMNT_0019195155 /DNA_START=1 /DNA_END=183 /DNA_ORIENTATION=-
MATERGGTFLLSHADAAHLARSTLQQGASNCGAVAVTHVVEMLLAAAASAFPLVALGQQEG